MKKVYLSLLVVYAISTGANATRFKEPKKAINQARVAHALALEFDQEEFYGVRAESILPAQEIVRLSKLDFWMKIESARHLAPKQLRSAIRTAIAQAPQEYSEELLNSIMLCGEFDQGSESVELCADAQLYLGVEVADQIFGGF